jgi:hypothetical protein
MSSGANDVIYLLSMFEAFKLAIDVPRAAVSPKQVSNIHVGSADHPIHITPVDSPAKDVLSIQAKQANGGTLKPPTGVGVHSVPTLPKNPRSP